MINIYNKVLFNLLKNMYLHIGKHLLFISLIFMLVNCQSKSRINYEIETSEGSITVELYADKAPITVANFMRYTDKKMYVNSSFFRVCNPKNEADREIQIEVIQGGLLDETNDFPPIQLETTEQTGIKHLDGVISMARTEPNSATNSFFICIGEQSELDFGGKRNPDGQGFAAFGKVTKGMDIVLGIQKMKDTSQYLIEPIFIKNIKRID